MIAADGPAFNAAINVFFARYRSGAVPTRNDLLAWWEALKRFDARVVFAAINQVYKDPKVADLPNAQHVVRVCESVAKCYAYRAPKADSRNASLPAPPEADKPQRSYGEHYMMRKVEELREAQRVAGVSGKLATSQGLAMIIKEMGNIPVITADAYKPGR